MEWMLVFSVLLAVLMMFKSGLRRTIDAKGRGLGDMLIWRWGANTVPEANDGNFLNDKNVLSKTLSRQDQDQSTLEKHDRSVQYNAAQSRVSRSVTLSTAKDQDYLLDKDAANDFGANLDITEDEAP